MDFFSLLLSKYILLKSNNNGGTDIPPDTSEEIILANDTVTFSFFEDMGGYITTEPIELPVNEDSELFMEAYTIIIDGTSEDYSLMSLEEQGAIFVGSDSGMYMMYMYEGNLILFAGEDIPDLTGEHNITIKKNTTEVCPYVIRIAQDGQLAWFILKDIVEGEAVVKAVNGSGEEICTTKLNFEPMGFNYYEDYIYAGSGHEKNMESVFVALQAGEIVTVYITQIVDGEEVVTTYGGIAPVYQEEGSKYNRTPQYYWGNNNIPCNS